MKKVLIGILVVLVEAMMYLFFAPFILGAIFGIFVLGMLAIAIGFFLLPVYLLYVLSEWLTKFL